MKVLSVCAFAALAALAALGADVSWTGGAGDNKWATGENWSTGSKPGEADVAVFAKAKLPSGSTVLIEQDETIKAIRFGDDVQGVVTDAPKRIDVSNATVVLEGSSYVIKGMRSVNGGLVINLR